ncbi:MAG TPA: FAD-binding protein, partial [Marmoricola sp.]|nr:FAD-binding protein [Marmoricola sp.]
MDRRAGMHWARWGDPEGARPLADEARALVDAFVGTREATTVAPAEVVLSPALRQGLVEELGVIVGAEQVSTDDDTRLRRTRGKSTPDLLAIRAGDGADSPDAVVRPGSHAEVLAVLDWAVRRHVAVVPHGGGTSVVGGLAARRDGFTGVISLDLVRLDRLVGVDVESMTAELEAGLTGPQAESLLAGHGLTLGHFPQSFEYATIGGFAATRSSGQSSAGYGRFDQMVVGLTVATPRGTWQLGRAPATAAGPDLRQLVLGSEGALGVITRVRVRVRPAPEATTYDAWRFASFSEGCAAMRTLAQSTRLPTVLRLSDETETLVNLAAPDEVGATTSEAGCLLVVGHEGTQDQVELRRAAAAAVLAAQGGADAGGAAGQAWADGRFRGPYLRDSLLDAGVLVETLETATFWSNLDHLYARVKDALVASLEGALVLCHVSHVYETGASLYFTVAVRAADDPVAQWRVAKSAASDAILA